MTQSTNDPWGCGSDAPDLPSAVAAAVMALDWAAPTNHNYMHPQDLQELYDQRYAEVQAAVQAATQHPTEKQPAPMLRSISPVKPENLQRALDLVRTWDRLCQLQLAAHNPPVGVTRRVQMQVKSLGLDRYDFFDVVDLNAVGVDVATLSAEALRLVQMHLRQAVRTVLGELNQLGVDTLSMSVKHDKALDRLVNNPARDQAPSTPAVQP